MKAVGKANETIASSLPLSISSYHTKMEALVRLILIAGVCCSLGALWYTRRKRTVIYPDLPFASLDDKEVGDPDVCRMQFMADCNGLLKKGSEKVHKLAGRGLHL